MADAGSSSGKCGAASSSGPSLLASNGHEHEHDKDKDTNKSVTALAATLGIDVDSIFIAEKDLPPWLINVEEHVITVAPVPSPAPPRHRSPGDEAASGNSYWIKVSSSSAMKAACGVAPEAVTMDGGRRVLHVHVLPSIPLADADEVYRWFLYYEEGCNMVNIFVTNQHMFRGKLDAFSSIDGLRRRMDSSREEAEDRAVSLRILANDRAKQVDEWNRRYDSARRAYLAVAVQDDEHDLHKALRKEVLVARRAHRTLDEAAVVMRSLVDSLADHAVRLVEQMQELTLMGSGYGRAGGPDAEAAARSAHAATRCSILFYDHDLPEPEPQPQPQPEGNHEADAPPQPPDTIERG